MVIAGRGGKPVRARPVDRRGRQGDHLQDRLAHRAANGHGEDDKVRRPGELTEADHGAALVQEEPQHERSLDRARGLVRTDHAQDHEERRPVPPSHHRQPDEAHCTAPPVDSPGHADVEILWAVRGNRVQRVRVRIFFETKCTRSHEDLTCAWNFVWRFA